MKFNKVLFCILALLFFTNAALAQVPSYVSTNGLVGWYSFNGNANDASSFANHGTVNGATLTADRFGVNSRTYNYNGVNSNIDLGINSAINSITNNFTISIWMKTDTLVGTIFASYADWSIGGYRFNIRLGDTGKVECAYLPASGTWQKTFSIKNSIEKNKWINIIYVRNGSTSEIYLDGSQNNGVVHTTDAIKSFAAITKIGLCFPCTGGKEYYKGNIDDIGIWNRALDSNEIKKLFTGGCLRDEITTEPSNASKPTTSTAKFYVTAKSGSAYQWQTTLNDLDWQNLPAKGVYSGVSTSSLSINNLKISNHKQQFRAVVSNVACKDTSKVVELIITDTCINTKSVSVADTLKFAVNLTGVAPPNNRNTMKVYPNPTNSAVVIDNGNYTTMANYIVKIENSIGQQVFFSKVNQQQFVVDVSTLGGKGIYTLSVLDPTGKLLETKKIVLN